MQVAFLAAAEREFVEAIRFYNSESEGLGYEFATEVNRTLGRIIAYPNAWHPSPSEHAAAVGDSTLERSPDVQGYRG